MAKTLAELSSWREVSEKAWAQVRWARAKAIAGSATAAAVMLEGDPRFAPHLEHFRKSDISALSTAPASSASALGEPNPYGAGFLALVNPRTLFGRMLGIVPVPMNVKITAQLEVDTLADFIGESKPVPVTPLSLESLTLRPAKLAIAAIFSKELARSSDPAANIVIERDLVKRVAGGTDVAALDPTRGPIANERPGALTFGATEITPSGDIEIDVALLLGAISGGSPAAPYLACSPRVALFLSTRRSSNGERTFPDAGLLGGSILGVPLLVCTHAPDNLVALDATGVALADAGVELDSTEEASVQMSDTPTNSSGGAGSPAAPTPTDVVSLWESNAIAIKATRFISWVRRHDACAFLPVSGSPLP